MGVGFAQQVPVVCVDGPSGSGKGTISRMLAAKLGWHLLDSGALYRLTALAAMRRSQDLEDEAGLARVARDMDVAFEPSDDGGQRILLEGRNVTGEIRREEVGEIASRVAAMKAVRRALVVRQRAFRQPPGLVADGRDMGTVIFPDAPLKIFLTASAEERARRRHKQLIELGFDASLQKLVEDIAARDRRDAERAASPLKPADDAVEVDTTGVPVETVLSTVLDLVRRRGLADGAAG